jgi:hypothetical protein
MFIVPIHAYSHGEKVGKFYFTRTFFSIGRSDGSSEPELPICWMKSNYLSLKEGSLFCSYEIHVHTWANGTGHTSLPYVRLVVSN